jgi:hypothetical protein
VTIQTAGHGRPVAVEVFAFKRTLAAKSLSGSPRQFVLMNEK